MLVFKGVIFLYKLCYMLEFIKYTNAEKTAREAEKESQR